MKSFVTIRFPTMNVLVHKDIHKLAAQVVDSQHARRKKISCIEKTIRIRKVCLEIPGWGYTRSQPAVGDGLRREPAYSKGFTLAMTYLFTKSCHVKGV